MPEFKPIEKTEYESALHARNTEYAAAIEAAMTSAVKAEFDDSKAANKAASRLRGIAKKGNHSVVVTVRGTSVLIASYDQSLLGKPAAKKPRKPREKKVVPPATPPAE